MRLISIIYYGYKHNLLRWLINNVYDSNRYSICILYIVVYRYT